MLKPAGKLLHVEHFYTAVPFEKGGRFESEFDKSPGRVRVAEGGSEFWKVYVPYWRKDWIQKVRTLPGRRWSASEKCWQVPMVKDNIKRLKALFGNQLDLNVSLPGDLPEYWIVPMKEGREAIVLKAVFNFSPMAKLALETMEEKMMLERKSWNTRRSYLSGIRELFSYYPKARPSAISLKQLDRFLIHKIKSRGIARSTQNQFISAFNFFFGKVCGQMEKVMQLRRPKKEKKLPNVLSEEEVQLLLEAVENHKHRCMLMLIYSAGLRKSELLNLRIEDLKFDRGLIYIKDSKGSRDRFSLFSPIAQKHLQRYMDNYQPRYWLFEGYAGGRYSESSMQAIFRNARKKSGVNPCITLHGLRHSFATHLVESGVALHVVRQLLGHSSIKTTEIYLHISKGHMASVKSPLENLNI